jgi:hypothetical protein
VLPLNINGRTVTYEYVDYDAEAVSAKKKAAEHYYENGQKLKGLVPSENLVVIGLIIFHFQEFDPFQVSLIGKPVGFIKCNGIVGFIRILDQFLNRFIHYTIIIASLHFFVYRAAGGKEKHQNTEEVNFFHDPEY